MRGPGRLAPLLAALHVADQGTYLPSIDSAWAEERRQRLDELMRSARLDAAEAAYSGADYHLAGHLADQVVAADPYREGAWRLQMRLAATLGDADRVIAAYRACERALGELGTTPVVHDHRSVARPPTLTGPGGGALTWNFADVHASAPRIGAAHPAKGNRMPSSWLLITNATVVDGLGNPAIAGAAVLVRDRHIHDVGTDVSRDDWSPVVSPSSRSTRPARRSCRA